jgi:Ca-activated chloride channel family protein
MRTETRSRCVLLTLVLGASVALSGQEERRDQALFLSSRTELVVLPVTVVARDAHFASNLTREHFRVYDNDVLQPVTFFVREDAPVTVGIVVDNSGSMRQKRDDVRAAGLAFARLSNPLDELFTVNFNEHVWTGLPAGVPFTDDPEQLRVALATMKAVGLTALYDATLAALDQAETGTKMQKVLILVSDGGDNASHQTLEMVVERARRANVVIYAVGIIDENDDETDRGVLKRLAQLTGGEAFFPENARQISEAFVRIAEEIRSSYILGYVPPADAQHGSFRRTRVTATNPDLGRLTARTRSGYVAGR